MMWLLLAPPALKNFGLWKLESRFEDLGGNDIPRETLVLEKTIDNVSDDHMA